MMEERLVGRAGAQAAPEKQRGLHQRHIMVLHQKHPQPIAQHSLHAAHPSSNSLQLWTLFSLFSIF